MEGDTVTNPTEAIVTNISVCQWPCQLEFNFTYMDY